MALKNDYGVIDQQGFDKSNLSPGDAAFRAVEFKEKKTNEGRPIIELGLELHWSSNEADNEHAGKKLDHAVFFGGPNGAITVRQLKDFAKASGCKVNEWTEDNNMNLGTMLPGFLKLLVYKNYLIQCKMVPGKGKPGEGPGAPFLNFIKVLRADPGTGEPVSDRPPDEGIPHELILEAIEAEVAGEKKGGAGSDTPF